MKAQGLIYHDLKNFSNQQFQTEPVKELNENNVDESQFELFQTITLRFLNKLAPSKKKTLRNNRSSFITREVQKAMMVCSRLCNKFLRTKWNVNRLITNKEIFMSQWLEKQRKITLETSM